MTTTKTMSK